MSYPPRSAPQVAAETLVKGASTNKAKRTSYTEVKNEVEVDIASEEHSFSIVEHCYPCCLDYCRSTIMQGQLDKLHAHFKIPSVILIKASRGDESPWDG